MGVTNMGVTNMGVTNMGVTNMGVTNMGVTNEPKQALVLFDENFAAQILRIRGLCIRADIFLIRSHYQAQPGTQAPRQDKQTIAPSGPSGPSTRQQRRARDSAGASRSRRCATPPGSGARTCAVVSGPDTDIKHGS